MDRKQTFIPAKFKSSSKFKRDNEIKNDKSKSRELTKVCKSASTTQILVYSQISVQERLVEQEDKQQSEKAESPPQSDHLHISIDTLPPLDIESRPLPIPRAVSDYILSDKSSRGDPEVPRCVSDDTLSTIMNDQQLIQNDEEEMFLKDPKMKQRIRDKRESVVHKILTNR